MLFAGHRRVGYVVELSFLVEHSEPNARAHKVYAGFSDVFLRYDALFKSGEDVLIGTAAVHVAARGQGKGDGFNGS